MRIICLISLLIWSVSLAAGQVELQNIRIWAAPDSTRVVFDISEPVAHTKEILADPHRLVIDLKNTISHKPVTQPTPDDKFVKQVRSGQRGGGVYRMVMDLKSAAESNVFLLPPNKHYGHRLVIDIFNETRNSAIQKVNLEKKPDLNRDIVIAIDAGHGGEDPGAKGPGGVYEKDVVMQISRKLANLINQERGMRAVLIRDGDYFLKLRKRINKAREHKADLFVSIHADAFKDKRVHGSSVYILSQKGASSEAAKWLAEQENASDLIGGVSLDDKDDMLASVLLDLSQTASLEASIDIADRVLGSLKGIGKVHKRRVESAGFAVLKSPDVPSILIETTFISNPQEEKKLKDSNHQAKIARAIHQGLVSYFMDKAPEGTLLASRKHVIVRGDTLSTIAQQYAVSTHLLRQHNGLKGDHIRIGQVLRIPSGGGG